MNLRHIYVFNDRSDLVNELQMLRITISFLIYIIGTMERLFTEQGLHWKMAWHHTFALDILSLRIFWYIQEENESSQEVGAEIRRVLTRSQVFNSILFLTL